MTRSSRSASWRDCVASRRRLLASARGRVVELGAGTGLNLRYYPDGLEALILVEPDAAMRRRLARRVRGSGRVAHIVEASAERLPLADHSVDTIVATLVLCTVDEPQRALEEIARVLRPDGELLFVEHVRADSSRLARWQDRLSGALAALRLRLPLQPRHGRADARLRVRARGWPRRPGGRCRRSSGRSRSGTHARHAKADMEARAVTPAT